MIARWFVDQIRKAPIAPTVRIMKRAELVKAISAPPILPSGRKLVISNWWIDSIGFAVVATLSLSPSVVFVVRNRRRHRLCRRSRVQFRGGPYHIEHAGGK